MTEQPVEPAVQLPPRPEGFICHRIGGGSTDNPPLPRNWKFVTSMEFNQSPGSSYTEKYYVRLSRKRPGWELWSDGYDDENHYREIYAVGPNIRIPHKVAAIHLHAAAWKATYDHEPWYRVGREGLISADEIDAIFEMLFPALTNAESESPSAVAIEETTHD